MNEIEAFQDEEISSDFEKSVRAFSGVLEMAAECNDDIAEGTHHRFGENIVLSKHKEGFDTTFFISIDDSKVLPTSSLERNFRPIDTASAVVLSGMIVAITLIAFFSGAEKVWTGYTILGGIFAFFPLILLSSVSKAKALTDWSVWKDSSKKTPEKFQLFDIQYKFLQNILSHADNTVRADFAAMVRTKLESSDGVDFMVWISSVREIFQTDENFPIANVPQSSESAYRICRTLNSKVKELSKDEQIAVEYGNKVAGLDTANLYRTDDFYTTQKAAAYIDGLAADVLASKKD